MAVRRVIRCFFALFIIYLSFIVAEGLSFLQIDEKLEVKIALSPGYEVLQGQLVTIRVTIKNLMDEPIGSEYNKPITITLRYEGIDENTKLSAGRIAVIKDEEALPPNFEFIKPNQEKTFRETFDTLRAGIALPAGNYEISADVLVIWTITNEVIATSLATTNLKIKASEIKPDLVLESINLKYAPKAIPIQEVIDDEVSFNIEPFVRNIGTASVDERSTLLISRRLKGQPNFESLRKHEVPEMDRGDEFKALSFDRYEWPPGVYIIQAWVDSDGQVDELLEGNNVLSRFLFIINYDQMKWTYPCISITILRDDEPQDLECDRIEKIGAIEAGPVLVRQEQDTLIYFGSDNGYLYVVRSSGTYVDRYPRSGPPLGAMRAAPAVSGGTIYLVSDDGHLYALDLSRQKKWQYPEEGEAPLGPIRATPAITVVTDGDLQRTLIYFGSDDGNLYALEDQGDSAVLRWTFPTGAFIRTTPAIATVTEGGVQKRLIYFGSGDGNLYALEDRGSNAVLYWTFPTGSFIKSSPKIFNQTVYFGSSDGHLYALFLDGTKKWQYPGESERSIGAVESMPLVVGDQDGTVIYFGSNDGSLYKLEEDEGGEMSESWRFDEYEGRPLGPIRSSPVLQGEMIYFGSDDGTLYAVKDRGRSVSDEWAFPTRGAITGPPAIGGNTLYLTSWEGMLYALKLARTE